MKPLKKIILIVIILVCIVVLSIEYRSLGYEEQKQEIQGGTMSYLQALCDKDFTTCDLLTASDGFKFTGFDRTLSSFSNPVSSKVYYQFLDYAVDSIQSIKIESITENIDTGYTEYAVNVTYIPYEKITSLVIDAEELNDVMDKYTSDKMSEDELDLYFQDYYFELFKSCFNLSSEEYVTSKVLMLSEKEDENGAVYVYNTKTFVEGLISDEMYENLEVYQNNIKAKVDTVLRQY